MQKHLQQSKDQLQQKIEDNQNLIKAKIQNNTLQWGNPVSLFI
ncbi:hypothetical protein [Acinetobacter guillouiae]